MMEEYAESTVSIMINPEHIEDIKIEVKTEAIDPLDVDTLENIGIKDETAQVGGESSDIQGIHYTYILYIFLHLFFFKLRRIALKISNHMRSKHCLN